jgi:predicted membrane-bound spermidine synthase
MALSMSVTDSTPHPLFSNPPLIPSRLLFGVFVISGLSALLYQTVWQRSLFMLYGSNVECVAMVVSAFLLGLGLGSLVGGAISQRPGMPLIALFALCELGVGLYGLFSLHLFRWVGELTLGVGTLVAGALAFGLLLVPTLLMGATLPLLVTHQVLTHGSVGRSVSWLYFVNTLGAALGAFLAAFIWLGRFGQLGSVRLAALLNLLAASLILGSTWWKKRTSPSPHS